MVVLFIVEAVVSAVGAYNITKGVYNMYCDADKIKRQYRHHQRIAEEYLIAQGNNRRDPLTESQFERYEDNFIVLNKSTILDPYNSQ